MSMFDFFFHSENYLFSGALILMLFIAILEGILVLIGTGLSDSIESLIPDFDTEVDLNIEESSFALSKFFSWIRIKQVPLLMLLVIFLTSFGIVGLSIQVLLLKITSIFWPAILISIIAFLISIYSLRVFGGLVARILPKDETSSISTNDLIGHIAIITIGKAKKGLPAEARTKDRHGQSHYFMVEPNEDDIEFIQGEKVLILGKIDSHFYATKEIPEKLK